MSLPRFLPVLVLASVLTACSGDKAAQQKQAAAPPPPEVGVVTLKSETVTLTRELPGRANPYLVAEVRPQVTGIVERVTLRTTTLRDSNGDVHIVASGDIRMVTNKTKGYSRVVLDVGFPHSLPLDRAFELLEGIGAEAAADPAIASDLLEAPEVVGIEAIEEHQARLRLSAKVRPARTTAVTRRIRYLVLSMFEREGLEVPSKPSA